VTEGEARCKLEDMFREALEKVIEKKGPVYTEELIAEASRQVQKVLSDNMEVTGVTFDPSTQTATAHVEYRPKLIEINLVVNDAPENVQKAVEDLGWDGPREDVEDPGF
jgi:hypothetical protein